jgi:hypothetical protein
MLSIDLFGYVETRLHLEETHLNDVIFLKVLGSSYWASYWASLFIGSYYFLMFRWHRVIHYGSVCMRDACIIIVDYDMVFIILANQM